MEKEIGQIKFTEIDDGFQIEVKGKSLKSKYTEIEDGFRVEVKGKALKEAFSRCCRPMTGASGKGVAICCTNGEDSCRPEKEKK